MRAVAIIGMGTMGRAIAERLPHKEYHIYAVERRDDIRARELSRPVEWHTTVDEHICHTADLFIIAVKPQEFPELADDISQYGPHIQGILSIMAGVSLATIADRCKVRENICARAMPNIAARYGRAAVALSYGDGALTALRSNISRIVSHIGASFDIDERHFDAFTGISASGIAFLLEAIRGVILGGVSEGIPYREAKDIVSATLGSIIALLQDGQRAPDELITAITSPGGTTIAGMQQLHQRGVVAAMIEAVRSATARSRELSGI